MHYHKFLTLEITHSYFDEGVSQSFGLAPFQDTANLLNNYNILIRKDKNRFEFYAGSNDQDSFDMATRLAGLGLLHFQLMNDDPSFITYTSDLPISTQGILHIKNVPESNQLQIDFGPAHDQIDTYAIGVLLLDIQTVIEENDPELQLILPLSARELLWEYQFVILESRNMEVSKMHIEGIGNENYLGPVDGTLMETQKTKVMTTDRPVALSQKLEKYPTLKLNYIDTITNQARHMEIKLPNPSPESIKTEPREGVRVPSMVTTIIYV